MALIVCCFSIYKGEGRQRKGWGIRVGFNQGCSPPPPGQLYQPFHPSPSPLPPSLRNLDLTQRLQILRDRMGLWHEYAPLVSSLSRDGFNPSSIQEATGISGVEQNCLVVASQVRDSLLDDKVAAFPPDLLPYFAP